MCDTFPSLNVLYEINVYNDYTHQTVASHGIYLTSRNISVLNDSTDFQAGFF